MNNTTKNQQDRDVVCKNHLTKSERDLYRVCPSKLSKRELENLYFALLENNLDLKKTLHAQQDRLKVLSTKLQRMTTMQRSAAGREKNCCPSKGIVNEQKETILELKKANERMTDRVRVLNMRLCSAKQFVKCSPPQVIGRCPRCASAASPFKNSSMSALNAKPSEVSVKMNAVSCQYLSDEAPECHKNTRTVETTTDQSCPKTPCNENKCRTTMDEMKQKILNLQEELAKTHTHYCNRITNLENDVSYVHNENVRIKNHNVANENAIEMAEKQAELLRQKLREAERQINDITMELTIEKRKVAELETSLKLSSSNQMVQMIEKLNSFKKQRPQSPMEVLQATGSCCSYRSTRQFAEDDTSPKVELQLSSKEKEARSPKSNDSGCTDLYKSTEPDEENINTKGMSKMNQEMWKKISDLQTQLDTLRIQAAASSKLPEKDISFDSANYENEMAVITITEDRTDIVLEVQDLNPLGVNEAESQAEINTKQSTSNKEVSETSDDKAASSRQPWADAASEKGKDINNSSADIDTRLKDQIKIDTCKKHDTDNRYQIPGPIPSLINNIDNKNTVKNGQSLSKTSKDSNEISDKKNSDCKTDCNQNSSMHKNSSLAENAVSETEKSKSLEQKRSLKIDPVETGNATSVIITNSGCCENSKILDKLKTDSIDLNYRKLTKDNLDFDHKKKEDFAGVKESSTGNNFHVNDITTESSAAQKNAKDCCRDSAPSDINTDEYGQRAPVDTAVQSLQHRDSASQNSCSHRGSPLYKTADPSGANRPVGCSKRSSIKNDVDNRRGDGYKDSATQSVPVARRDSATYNLVPLSKDSATQNNPQRRDSATYTAESLPSKRDSATYTAGAPAQTYCRSRATSPANTEREISSLSDLPPERDARRTPLSPGETQYASCSSPSHSHSVTAPDYGALSDGELPAHAQHATRYRKLSFGEKPTYVDPLPEDSNSQMEATLNAISAELARCRQLLTNSRSQEVWQCYRVA